MTVPAGGVYLYKYDESSSIVLSGQPLGNNLTSVTYPDGSIRQYWYNEQDKTGNTNQPHALTGITDKKASSDPGTRYASYWYDAQGRAVKEEHAPSLNQGIDRYQLTYNTNATGNPTNTIVTDALGTARTYNFTTVLGVVKSLGTNQPGGSGCAAAASGITYDPNGNVASRTDFNQHKTCSAYDALGRNLEIARAEGLESTTACPADVAAWAAWIPAANTAQRKITTTWHPTYRLPLVITEPGRTTTDAYDIPGSDFLLHTRSIKDTATNKTRTWTYTYTSATDNTLLNLLKSIDGPRTDIADTTTYTYYSADDSTLPIPKYRKGDLWKITNALGHITTITAYDGNGRPITIIDPNTVTTTLAFTRGWLKTRTVGTKTTTYDYDAVGQLIKVTLADTSHIDYTYDAAHRLTDISDTQLNRIHYTLDAIGNRTKEEIFDANNVLSTTKSHSFDALSRLMTDVITYNQGATSTTLYTYDAAGNMTTVVEGQGTSTPHTTTFNYDALNRLIYVGDALNQISNPTSYTYDGLDQLKSVTIPRRSVNPADITTAYTVNALGEATQQTSPDSGITNRTYDAAGNLKTATDARGITSNYTWDALNRLTSITYPATGENIAYIWDSSTGCNYGIGRLCRITDAEGSTTYSYDDQGSLTQQTRQIAGVNYTTGYGYDGANRLLTTTTPTGETQTLTRNPAGRINTIDTSNGIITTHLAKDIAYDGVGQVTAQTLGNGIKQSNSYDLAGLPSTRRYNAPDGDLNGDGIVDVADVALAERMALGLVTPTADQLVHGDVAPSGTPDGVIDAADVARIRRKALGLETF
ncbi:hypothetical protein [Sulfuricella denitrificans]|nr:hypothetical protein [Sulfuricella denitrificans]